MSAIDSHTQVDRGVGANPAVEAAAWLILGPALSGLSSPMLPGAHTWSAANARQIRKAISGDNADMGARSFLDKLHDQLSGLDDSVIVLAAEMLYVHGIPLVNLQSETKIQRIETVLSWTRAGITLPPALRHGLEAGGTFHGGAGFNIRIWQQLIWLADFIEEWWGASADERERALADPWVFRDLVDRVQGGWEPAMRMSLLALVWPGYFDSVVKDDHRRRIRDAFAHEIGATPGDPMADIDKDLWAIRTKIQAPDEPRFEWYLPPYAEQWHSETVNKGRRAWLVRPGQGGQQLVEQWRKEGFVSVPATNLSLDLAAPTDQSVRDAVEAGYAHLDYAQRLQLTQADQAFILRMGIDDLVLVVSEDTARLGVVSGAPTWAEEPGARLRRTVDWIPESVAKTELPEPVPGMLDKQGDVVDLTHGLDALTALAGKLTDTGDEDSVEEEQAAPRVAASVVIPPVTDALAAELHMPREVLQEWLDVLADRRQLVFYGPPGTGKTFVAEALGRHIVGSDTNHLRTVQFHPSYAYEDFFEGLRPVVENGNVTYKVVPGPLRTLVAEATTPGNESRPYVLVIDEMNRANLAKVFGELYYLLEYRDQSISLQYSSDSDFRLPKNLFIIGTMNTLDRSISMVDAAIRRRFPFVELHPSVVPVSGVLSAYLTAQGSDDRRARLLDALNAGIDERDLQIGPSYLMKHSAREHSGLERIWKYDILPLLDDHFYGARTPEQIRAQFGLDALLARLNGTPVGPVDAVLHSDVIVSVDETAEDQESADS